MNELNNCIMISPLVILVWSVVVDLDTIPTIPNNTNTSYLHYIAVVAVSWSVEEEEHCELRD